LSTGQNDLRLELPRRRLVNQRLASAPAGSAADVVRHLGAVQAQEYPVARWSVGQRSRGLSEASVDEALASGEILRTHVLRDTWHLVAAEDIRWLVELTRPRIRRRNEVMHRRLGLDARTLVRTDALLVDALAGNRRLTRAEIRALLRGHGIHADGQYLGYVLMHAELELVICSSGLDGKQQTYALLDERVGPTRPLRGDDALAELTRRYFSGHGPATAKDFAWWGSLTVGDARRGIELAGAALVLTEAEGRDYWSAPSSRRARVARPVAHLLPSYDEYVVGYSESRDLAGLRPGGRARLEHLVLLDGQVVGSWRRTVTPRVMTIETKLVRELDEAERRALDETVERFGRYVARPVSA